jgi:adenylate kinase
MRVIITGTPGTGKTAISKELGGLLSLPVVDIKEIVHKNKIFSKNKHGEMIVDIAKLKRVLLKERRSCIIDSHLVCEITLPADFVFVLRTEPEELRKRLAKRGYSRKKVDENVLCEMLDYCLLKSELNYRCRVLQLDTTGRTGLQSAKRIAMAIKNKKKRMDNVNHSKRLLKSLVS